MNLLIIGNPGAFSENIKKILSKNSKVNLHYVSKDIKVSQNIKEIKKTIKNKKIKFDFIIYLGGETREKNLMKSFNKVLLLKIYDICEKLNINLIYISSLAVYGIPKNSLVTNNSTRNPINYYGQTKNDTDIKLMKKNKNILIFNLLPSSIIIPNSKNGLYFKLKNLMQNKIIKLLFSILCPGGKFSFCNTYDIAEEIKKSISFALVLKKEIRKQFYFEKIVSREVSVRDIFYDANKIYPLITLPIINLKFIKLIFGFLNPTYLLRIIFLFSNIKYKNGKTYF